MKKDRIKKILDQYPGDTEAASVALTGMIAHDVACVLLALTVVVTLICFIGMLQYSMMTSGGGFFWRLLDALDNMDDYLPVIIGLWILSGGTWYISCFLSGRAELLYYGKFAKPDTHEENENSAIHVDATETAEKNMTEMKNGADLFSLVQVHGNQNSV